MTVGARIVLALFLLRGLAAPVARGLLAGLERLELQLRKGRR